MENDECSYKITLKIYKITLKTYKITLKTFEFDFSEISKPQCL